MTVQRTRPALPVGRLERLTPTHDLSAEQVAALAAALGPGGGSRLEAVVHQHLPVFHTAYCAFARLLSDGQSYKDCGHPCERHTMHMRDATGADHLVLADMGCRNTVFNAQARARAGESYGMIASYGGIASREGGRWRLSGEDTRARPPLAGG